MGAIAERRIFRQLARAEVHLVALSGIPYQWLEVGALMAAIAPRLVLGLTAGTPVVRLACFNVHADRLSGGGDGFLCAKAVLRIRRHLAHESYDIPSNGFAKNGH